MKNKMGSASMDDEDTSTILKQLEDDTSLPASSALTTDDYDWWAGCVCVCVCLSLSIIASSN